jgi:hypothetical protein
LLFLCRKELKRDVRGVRYESDAFEPWLRIHFRSLCLVFVSQSLASYRPLPSEPFLIFLATNLLRLVSRAHWQKAPRPDRITIKIIIKKKRWNAGADAFCERRDSPKKTRTIAAAAI